MNIDSYKNLLGNYNSSVNEVLANLYTPKEIANEEINNQGQGVSFGDIISSEMNKLNDKQVYADNMIEGLIRGEDLDLHQVMLATEEAKLSMELAVQVRNRVIEAFNEIRNIQL